MIRPRRRMSEGTPPNLTVPVADGARTREGIALNSWPGLVPKHLVDNVGMNYYQAASLIC
jgi:hypothetical protein